MSNIQLVLPIAVLAALVTTTATQAEPGSASNGRDETPTRILVKSPHYTSSPVSCRLVRMPGSYHQERICQTKAQWRHQKSSSPKRRQAADRHNPAFAVPRTESAPSD